MNGDAIVLVDSAGTIRYWSPGATTLFGHDHAKAVGVSLDLIVPPDLRERHWAGFERAWKQDISDAVRVALIPVLCADGQVRHFAGRFLPVRAPHGALVALMGVWSAPSGLDSGLFTLG